MSSILEDYKKIMPPESIDKLLEAAAPFKGKTFLHINSTKEGGGVAEILNRMIPLQNELGINAIWETIEGDEPFFEVTKSFHNGLQGNQIILTPQQIAHYRDINAKNAERLKSVIESADVVLNHDPQPAALISFFPEHKGIWLWRCHIDLSSAYQPLWQVLKPYVAKHHASIFHMAQFVQKLDHKQALIPPSIDAFSAKNKELSSEQINTLLEPFALPEDLPLVLQVSRFDYFKDPLGVIEASVKAYETIPHQLVLAGGGATDDPEGLKVLKEVNDEADKHKHVKVLMLPPDAHEIINALQRKASVVLQKSLKEGFGLTVSEAMWKERPVIGGNVGGITLQIENGKTGYLVSSNQQAAEAIIGVLRDPPAAVKMGKAAKEVVLNKFLLIRHLTDYLNLAKEFI